MPSERFFVHKEDGSLVRLKGRLVRFLDEEPPTGSDKSAIRTALEVSPDAEGLVQADVGTDPQNLVLHQHLGDLAYQSAEGISVGTLEADGKTTLTNDQDNALVVETTNQNPMIVNVVGSAPNYLFDVRDDDTSKFRVDGSGRVGIGTSSLGSYAAAADDLVVSTSGTTGVTIHSSSADSGAIYFADGTSGDERYRGIVRYNHGADQLELWSTSAHRWSVNASGNLAPASSGLGIDFGSGSAAGRTVESGLLDDYEEGSFTAEYVPQTGSFATMTMDFRLGRYTKVGNTVHFVIYMMTSNVDVTGASDSLIIRGLPFSAANHSGNYVPPVYVGDAVLWPNPYTPVGGYIYPNSKDIYLVRRSTSTSDTALLSASTMTTGAVAFANRIMVAGTYEAA